MGVVSSNIHVQITNIEVDDGFYFFNYKVWRDGELVDEDEYNEEHVWEDKEAFKYCLEQEGLAVELALEKAF